jgi:hypothetical protein
VKWGRDGHLREIRADVVMHSRMTLDNDNVLYISKIAKRKDFLMLLSQRNNKCLKR